MYCTSVDTYRGKSCQTDQHQKSSHPELNILVVKTFFLKNEGWCMLLVSLPEAPGLIPNTGTLWRPGAFFVLKVTWKRTLRQLFAF